MEYTAIRKYLNNYFDDIYLIRNNNTYYVYDYKHNLIDRFKRIDVCFLNVSQDQKIVYLTVSYRKYILIWDIYQKKMQKVTYTKRDIYSRPDLFDKENEIMIYYRGLNKEVEDEKEFRWENYKIVIDKETLQCKELLLKEEDNISYFQHAGKIYHTIESYEKNKNTNEYAFTLYDEYKEIYKTYIQEQPKFNISPSGKYAFVSSMLPHIDDKKCLGKIEILNFKTLKIIDEIKFYHIALYVMQAHFLEYNHQAYIIYQAHPYPCDLYNEKWSTYIYSIENKKIIYEAPFSFSLDYQEKRMRFILQRNKPRIETRFFELKDDLPPIEEILKEINKK